MTVFSRGYTSSGSSETEEQFSLLTENLDLIRQNEQRVLETAEYFFSELPFANCSWPYVGGDGPLPLGYLLLGWKDGILIEPCPDCKSGCLTFAFSGSPLSGSNNWTGFCKTCNERKYHRDTVHKPFYTKLNFIVDLRKKYPQKIKRWEEVVSTKFSFGGDGLEPAVKKELKTIELFTPIALTDVLHELKKGIGRPKL